MNRLAALIGRDLRASLRDFLPVYILVAPLLLATVLRLILPAAQSSSLNLVTTADADPAVVDRLAEYASVEVVDDEAALLGRVNGLDDAPGVLPTGDAAAPYQLVLQGNESQESRELVGLVLSQVIRGGPLADYTLADGGRTSPWRPYGALFLGLMSLLIGGMFMGFNIIEDKETRATAALAVTPLSQAEYVGARCLMAAVVATAQVFIGFWALGLRGIDWSGILVVTLSGTTTTIMMGLYLGATSSSVMTGVANMKAANSVFLAGPLLGLVIPQAYQFVLYPIPTYWTFAAYREILVEGTGAAAYLPPAGWNVVVSAVWIVIIYRFFARRVSVG